MFNFKAVTLFLFFQLKRTFGFHLKTSPMSTISDNRVNFENILPIGLGTWKIPLEKTATIVYESIKAGMRHIDCACDYGNEIEVGKGIQQAIHDQIVTRNELWITNKLWNTYHARDHVEKACTHSLSLMQLDYFDLYLVHFPISLKHVPIEIRYPPGWYEIPGRTQKIEVCHIPMSETWASMEDLVLTKKVARFIGVSNFNVQLLSDLLGYCRIRPFANQVELHPYLAQTPLVEWLASEQIHCIAYSPLGSSGYVELNMDLQLGKGCLLEESVLKLAKTYKKSPAQIILRWHHQRKIFPLFKTSSVNRIQENIDIFDFTLSFDDMKMLTALNNNIRFNDPCIAPGTIPIFD